MKNRSQKQHVTSRALAAVVMKWTVQHLGCNIRKRSRVLSSGFLFLSSLDRWACCAGSGGEGREGFSLYIRDSGLNRGTHVLVPHYLATVLHIQ